MMSLKKLPNLQNFSKESPKVVKVLDRIRFDLKKKEKYFEFCWFSREYPRCYRYHLECSKYRLKCIYQKYEEAHKYFSHKLMRVEENCYEMFYSNSQTIIIYWDFESYLSAINSALDLLARIVGTAYREQMPISFNKLCKKKNLDNITIILKKAQKIWISRMKNYHDCFIHFTPIDTILGISIKRYSNGWELYGKLPTNPNVRDILGFKFSRRIELLKYAISVSKHMSALDTTISKEIFKLYNSKKFPKRINNLFFLGSRKS